MGRLKPWEVVPGHLVKHLFSENLKTARQSCGWCSERCPCPGQEDWIRWSLKVPSVDQPSPFCGPVMQSCYSLCSCWVKGWPGNHRILPVWFWDFFNFCFNSMMSWKNLNCTKESFMGRLKPHVFRAWAHIWNANLELDMPEFGVKSRDREFQWCYLSCDEDLNKMGSISLCFLGHLKSLNCEPLLCANFM